ncbi:hypothetical protein Tco_0089758 [Tanacetum coccineum]
MLVQLHLFLDLAFRKSAALLFTCFSELHYWTLILEVSQTSTLITGVSLLIPSSSRIPTLPGHVANLLAILALYSTLPIVVTSLTLSVVSILLTAICFSESLRAITPAVPLIPTFIAIALITLMLSLSDSTFSGGGDDEGSAAANSVMHALVDDDRGKQTHQSQMPMYSHLEGTGSSVGWSAGSSSGSSLSTSESELAM